VRGQRDLAIAAWGSVLCALLAVVIPWPALSLVFAAPLALLAPGYAIVAATFARRDLGWQRAALLSLALSLATLVIGSFLLNYVPGGIRDISWAILLPLVTIGCCRAAALRRPKSAKLALPKPRIGRRDAAFVLGGVALGATALVLAMTTLPAKNARGYTELWVTPEASGTGGGAATVGVGSEEQHRASYVLRTRLGGGTPIVRRFTLRPGEERTIRLNAVPSADGAPVPVKAQLARAGRPNEIYRRVSASIPGSPQ
jgi:Protein of unknown function (DUF1616)